jgi:hypothetical protein
VKSERALSEPQGDGATLRQHLISLEAKTRKPHEMFSGRKPLRSDAQYLWGWWLEMRSDQGAQGSVNSRSMQDWQWLTGNRLDMKERKIIQILENQWRAKSD